MKPHACIICTRECDLDNGYRICSRCIDKIPFSKGNYCLKCGEVIKGEYDYCLNCKNVEYNFDYARSVFAYNDLTAPMIMRFKYNGYKSYAPHLGLLLKDFYSTSDLVADTVTYVPMPKAREKERGYNQAFELCKEFSLLTEMPMIDALIRVKEVAIKQATLSGKERRENIKGSFKITDKKLVKDKEILLIDDVFTTGATVSECAKVLMNAGAKNVQVLTLAKTVSGDSSRVLIEND